MSMVRSEYQRLSLSLSPLQCCRVGFSVSGFLSSWFGNCGNHTISHHLQEETYWCNPDQGLCYELSMIIQCIPRLYSKQGVEKDKYVFIHTVFTCSLHHCQTRVIQVSKTKHLNVFCAASVIFFNYVCKWKIGFPLCL